MVGMGKAEGALKTISEVSDQFAIPQHILRYWETRFPQLRPLQRAGNRRYYRPDDVALIARIHGLLNRDGYTIKGVQKLLSGRSPTPEAPPSQPQSMPTALPVREPRVAPEIISELRQLRAQLAAALGS